MWATYWSEQHQDAPTAITPDEDFTKWAQGLHDHPLYQDLPHGIAHDPAIDVYAEPART